MTSTDKPFVMPATQLAYSIKTLSESVVRELEHHKHLSEQGLDQFAEKLIEKLVVFINKHHAQTVTVEPFAERLPPRQRDAQYLRNVAIAAETFASLCESSGKPLIALQETQEYCILQEAIEHLIEDELVIPRPRNSALAAAKDSHKAITLNCSGSIGLRANIVTIVGGAATSQPIK